jgi:hypothetical protein
MHRAYAACTSPYPVRVLDRRSRYYERSLAEYGLAVADLRGLIEALEDRPELAMVETVLIVCLLFVSLEMLHDQQASAAAHLAKGLAVLFGHIRPYARTTGRRHRPIAISRKPQTALEALLAVFARLDHECTLFTTHEPYLAPNITVDDMSSSKSIEPFLDASDAKIHLDVLASETMRYRGALLTWTSNELDTQDELLNDWARRFAFVAARSRAVEYTLMDHCQKRLTQALSAWSSRFAMSRCGSDESTACLQLKLQFFYTWVTCSTFRSTRERSVDRFESTFAHITEVAEAYINALGKSEDGCDFNLCPAALPALYEVGLKCRSSKIRRKAIRLLRSASFREGMWQGAPFAVYLEQVAKVEEERTRTLNPGLQSCDDLKSSDVPEQARFIEVVFALDAAGSGRLACTRYAHEHQGELVLEEHHFSVIDSQAPGANGPSPADSAVQLADAAPWSTAMQEFALQRDLWHCV